MARRPLSFCRKLPEMSEPNSTEEIQLTQAQQLRDQVRQLVRSVARGRVISYGALGARCQPPISGYVCGRVMGQLMEDVPWWRVVGKSGELPISKRSPDQAVRQRALLESEGVRFRENAVERQFFEDETPGETPVQGALF